MLTIGQFYLKTEALAHLREQGILVMDETVPDETTQEVSVYLVSF
jgi:hypothetical protein